jgi:hypothetical protein
MCVPYHRARRARVQSSGFTVQCSTARAPNFVASLVASFADDVPDEARDEVPG